MTHVRKTLARVLGGVADAGIDFQDLCSLLTHLGFTERQRGSHHIFTHPEAPEIINLQPRGRHAKPYQVKQVRQLVLRHKLEALEDVR